MKEWKEFPTVYHRLQLGHIDGQFCRHHPVRSNYWQSEMGCKVKWYVHKVNDLMPMHKCKLHFNPQHGTCYKARSTVCLYYYFYVRTPSKFPASNLTIS